MTAWHALMMNFVLCNNRAFVDKSGSKISDAEVTAACVAAELMPAARCCAARPPCDLSAQDVHMGDKTGFPRFPTVLCTDIPLLRAHQCSANLPTMSKPALSTPAGILSA